MSGDQLSMFDAVPPSFPRARRSDPRSSHAAAAEIENTGSAKAYALLCFLSVKEFPGRTTQELCRVAGLDVHKAGRRLGELVKANRIRREEGGAPCSIGDRPATRWWPL